MLLDAESTGLTSGQCELAGTMHGSIRMHREADASRSPNVWKAHLHSLMASSHHAHFATTHWSLVLEAGDRSAPEADRALSELCGTYWLPLYAYARRSGCSREDAADRTQEFFARLIEKSFLETADPERGRFRSFLLTIFQRFLANEYARDNALRRGGGVRHIPFDAETAESVYQSAGGGDASAGDVFERQWALTLLHRAMAALRAEYSTRSRMDLFERCHGFLTGNSTDAVYSAAARELNMTEGAVRVAVHRLRERFRELLRQEVAATVSQPADVDDELLALRKALTM
jgi:RNA polymerase sigma-70 factor (ECF subfamily)